MLILNIALLKDFQNITFSIVLVMKFPRLVFVEYVYGLMLKERLALTI